MRKIDKLLWIVVVIIGITDLTVFLGHAKAPDKAAASTSQLRPLKPPATGKINVAFIVSNGANVMDIAGINDADGGCLRHNRFRPGDNPTRNCDFPERRIRGVCGDRALPRVGDYTSKWNRN